SAGRRHSWLCASARWRPGASETEAPAKNFSSKARSQIEPLGLFVIQGSVLVEGAPPRAALGRLRTHLQCLAQMPRDLPGATLCNEQAQGIPIRLEHRSLFDRWCPQERSAEAALRHR